MSSAVLRERWTIFHGWLCVLLAGLGLANAASGGSRVERAVEVTIYAEEVDGETVARWSARYRGWHYRPEHVIPAEPRIPGYEQFHNADCPCVYQLPGQTDKWFMSFIV